MKVRTADPNGGTSAFPCADGRIRLEIWDEEREPNDDPYAVTLTPGQAMGLVCDLSGAAKIALAKLLK